MVSINNTASNAVALASLRAINDALQTTQGRIASGLKVASARDNATVWTTANSLRLEQAGQDTVKAPMAVAKAKAETALAGLDTISGLVSKIREKLVAGQSGGDKAALDVEIGALQSQIKAAIAGSSFKGENWLDGSLAADPSVSLDGTSTNVATIAINTDAANTTIYKGPTSPSGILYSATGTSNVIGFTLTTNGTSAANITLMITAADSALTKMSNYTTKLSGFVDTIDTQVGFLDKLKDIRSTAISSLVDADMEEESARLQSLQVKQQLAYQALSIGNASAQNVLRLFQ